MRAPVLHVRRSTHSRARHDWRILDRSSPMPPLAATLVLLALACSDGVDAPAMATDAAPAAGLCDGSSSARLAHVVSGGGQAYPDVAFTNPHGYRFFVIDGGCRFWAGENYTKGVRAGTLTPAMADSIGRRLQFGDFARLKQCTPDGIDDAASSLLSDGTNTVNAACKSDGAPVGYVEMVHNLSTVVQELPEGPPADLPLRVAAIADDLPPDPPSPSPWSLSWSPREVLTGLFALAADSGRLVTDPDEVFYLRSLRQQTPMNSSPHGVRVRTRPATHSWSSPATRRPR